MSRITTLPALGAGDYIGGRLPPSAAEPVERITPIWCDAPDWQHRWWLFYHVLPGAPPDGVTLDWRPARGGLVVMLTALLEELGETSIGSIEAASLYSVAMHPEWRAAARQYVRGCDAVTLDSWLGKRPDFVSFGISAAALYAGDCQS